MDVGWGLTESLLVIGIVTAVIFQAVLFVEGAIRPGYNPSYHTGSELALGDRGWVQAANFLLMGLGTFAFAAGVDRVLDSTAGAILLTIFGVGLLLAGVFRPDPLRGYPPDASREVTWQGQVHNATGPIMFLALFAACLTIASALDGPWQLYTVITATVGLGMTIWTAISFQRDAANTGLIQRCLIAVYWAWVILVGIHLVINPPSS